MNGSRTSASQAGPSLGYRVPPSMTAAIDHALEEWTATDSSRRLWAGDSTLWTGGTEASWLGWLTVVDDQIANVGRLRSIAEDIRASRFSHALLVGMGGSSLCPDVLRATFGRVPGFPDLHVIDSTDPLQIADVESGIDLARTIVIVSSKSGSTLEPNILLEYFYNRLEQVVGTQEAGRHFCAITDPGSSLDRNAVERGFSRTAHGWPSIGGRYSALSAFGMVPAALIGVDVARLLGSTARMVRRCGPAVPPRDNPGVLLGVLLGTLARHGRDKLTLITSPGISGVGAWIEQLVAESTGKLGRGIVPVDLEPLGRPDQYGDDRVFAYLRLDAAPDAAEDAAVAALEQAGHAVLRIDVAGIYDLGQEFFRWEMATAAAGATLGVNPFDQPDVEASKVAARRLTDEYETSRTLPAETPFVSDGPLTFHADALNASEIARLMGSHKSAAACLRAHFGRLRKGDYAALLAYLPMNRLHQEQLQDIRRNLRDRHGVATCLGFGPRFLHSTGQLYKGGPESGVFLQMTCDDREDLPVPGRNYTFGIVKAAQARGDFQVLADRRRRLLGVHLGGDVQSGLTALQRAVDEALGA